MAFLLSLALFGYFWVVGFAVVGALNTQRDLVRNALIAPAVGVAVTIYSLYVPSRLGFAVNTFAALHAIALVGLAGFVLLWRRPLLPVRRLLPFAPLLLAAFVLNGWPLLTLGFTWFGSFNPDMVNYVLDSTRLAEQPFIHPPDPKTWLSLSDWAAYFLFFQVFGIRSANDLLLASLMSLTGKSGLSLYMPLMVALQGVLISAATALITTPYRYARLLTLGLLSCSAMMTLGLTLQLFGQVIGLIMLTLGCVLCLTPFYRLVGSSLYRFVALATVVMGTFVLTYPEVLPFFGLAFLIHHAMNFNEVRKFLGRMVATTLVIAVVGSALIAPDVFSLLIFLFSQTLSAGAKMRHPELFPYLLKPSGLGTIWGLNHYVSMQSRMLPFTIVAGVILGAWAIVSTYWQAYRLEPAAAVAAVMIPIGFVLFSIDSGFGMLKLAMYAQPFLLATVTLALCLQLRASR